MKRVSELEHEPAVGKRYLVPCVKNQRGKWMPVIGSKHHDIEYIGIRDIHYHYDFRFVKQHFITERFDCYPFNHHLVCTSEEFAMGDILKNTDEPTERVLICLRWMPVFPLSISGAPISFFKPLEQAFKDVKLNCARCPHRGMPLSADNVDKNGVVVCPGHGLAWNLSTGQLVSRLKAVNA